MNIVISPFITSRTYNIDLNSSVSFIYDERERIYYVLKNELSKLWDVIFSALNYEKVFLYAQQNKCETLCNEFIAELKVYGFISINKEFKFNGYKFLNNIVKESDNDSYDTLDFYFSKIRRKLNLLDSISIQPTYKCNQYCKHCFNPKDNLNDEISFEVAKRFIDEAYELGITSVNLTGGECTFSKDFLKIIQYIREKHLFLSFQTNGLNLYNDEFFDEVVNLYPNRIQISLYSMNPDIHDYLTTVEGSHYKTISVIKKLKKKNINVSIACPVFSVNKNDYIDVLNFAKKTGVLCLYSPGFINNINNNNGYIKLSEKELEEFYYKEIQLGNFKRSEFTRNKECICYGKIYNLNLAPNLNISICNDFNYVLGNFTTTSLKEMVQASLCKVKTELISEKLDECFKYDYCKFCTYCIKNAMFESGFMKKANSICEDARAYHNALKRLSYN